MNKNAKTFFPDIRGSDYPMPYFDSKVKVRWDDNRMYVGARMEQTDFWGNLTEDESLGNTSKNTCVLKTSISAL